MARILKSGLDYFPLDVDFLQDRKIRRLMRKHGAIAATAILALYSSIYREKGYYIRWDEDTCFDLTELVGIQMDVMQAIIEDAVQSGLLHKDMYETYGIITSEAIQKQYIQCTLKRKAVVIDEKYNLLTGEPETPQNDPEIPVETNKSSGNSINSPQNLFSDTEIKQSKEKEKKKKENLPLTPSENGVGKTEERPEDDKFYYLNKNTHNYEGLLDRLTSIGVTDEKEIKYILRLSDYGRLGHRVWKLIVQGAWPRNITAPGKYLISCLKNPK